MLSQGNSVTGGAMVDQGTGARELAATLTGLKERSGLSYQDLAETTYTSRSTLHRYCTGRGIPSGYDAIARFAQACEADPEELTHLLRCWRAATGAATASHLSPQPLPDPPGGKPSGTASYVVRLRRTREVRLRRAYPFVLVLVLLATTVASVPFRTADRLTALTAENMVAGMSWAEAPSPVIPEGFGTTLNSSSGAMPGFRVGAVRLWDSETRWAQLQPQRGTHDWATLDRLLDSAKKQNLPTLFVFGGTPGWAAPGARRAAYPDGSRAAPPDNLNDWDTFVRALVDHAGDRIDAYELWVMANHPHHYNGSVKTLVEMTRRASTIIREQDRQASLVCPSVTGLWGSEGHAFLRRFAELGGYQYCDAAGIKLYQRRVQDPPETMLEAARSAYRTFHRVGVHLPLWNTGTTQTLPLNDPLDPQRAAEYAVRFYLTGLYARPFGIERMYFYAWGNSTIPIVLQAEGQLPTKAGLYVERLQRWLGNAQITACGQGQQVSLPGNVWQCEFSVTDGGNRAVTAWIRWTHAGEADTPIGPREVRVHHLDGTARDAGPGDTVRVTGEPLLVTHRRVRSPATTAD